MSGFDVVWGGIGIKSIRQRNNVRAVDDVTSQAPRLFLPLKEWGLKIRRSNVRIEWPMWRTGGTGLGVLDPTVVGCINILDGARCASVLESRINSIYGSLKSFCEA